MRIQPNQHLKAAAAALNYNVEIDVTDFEPGSSSGVAIRQHAVRFSNHDSKIEVTFYLFPHRNESSSDNQNRAANFLVLSFLRVTRLNAHIWREMFRKSFVFSFQGVPGSTLDDRSLLELAPASNLLN